MFKIYPAVWEGSECTIKHYTNTKLHLSVILIPDSCHQSTFRLNLYNFQI